ncbi:MAG: 50S ribosomal protein L25 [bacterium]|nr:50S ribosomal protein L25 [bacterium]
MTTLHAEKRTIFGKKVKNLRKEGVIPAVVYGESVETMPLSVPRKDFEKVYREAGESTVVELKVEGKPLNVLIYDVTTNALKGDPEHIDFYALRMDKKVKMKVPLEFIGESPAVNNDGGVFVKVMQEVEIEALPKDLPHELHVDISGMAVLESRIFIKDIKVPAGVVIEVSPEDVIAIVEAPRSEEEIAALGEAPVAESPTEVKTEREVKQEVKAEKEKEEKAEEEKK